ncbi:MAG TPA: VOC family protein [Gammaproteobacteria bacterium]|nr:VOC family protein [Gammaproteobacteria bacterium]
MRFRGVHHVEFSVLDYENSVRFYDRMFGWLGYRSFWTLNVGYTSTYYMARFPLPHSYIGIQPAAEGGRLDHAAHAAGIHHIAIWARNRREVDRFHARFLLPEGLTVTDAPAEYPIYAPGYYAVFFLDPTGIRWELAAMPRIPRPGDVLKTLRAARQLWREHPEWKRHPAKEMMRTLPSGDRSR